MLLLVGVRKELRFIFLVKIKAAKTKVNVLCYVSEHGYTFIHTESDQVGWSFDRVVGIPKSQGFQEDD